LVAAEVDFAAGLTAAAAAVAAVAAAAVAAVAAAAAEASQLKRLPAVLAAIHTDASYLAKVNYCDWVLESEGILLLLWHQHEEQVRHEGG
jgi:hypothetical protein